MPLDAPKIAPPLTVFLLLRTTPAWLALSRADRTEIANASLGSALDGLPVTLRYFDSEAFSGLCSDIAQFEAPDILTWMTVMERLRDSLFFTVPYFDLVQAIPAVEYGFRAVEEAEADRVAAQTGSPTTR